MRDANWETRTSWHGRAGVSWKASVESVDWMLPATGMASAMGAARGGSALPRSLAPSFCGRALISRYSDGQLLRVCSAATAPAPSESLHAEFQCTSQPAGQPY